MGFLRGSLCYHIVVAALLLALPFPSLSEAGLKAKKPFSMTRERFTKGLVSTLIAGLFLRHVPDANGKDRPTAKPELKFKGRTAHSIEAHATYSAIYDDTRAGLEKMRDPRTGLISDRLDFLPSGETRLLRTFMPTNIGLDLLLMCEDQRRGYPVEGKVLKALKSLEAMPKLKIDDSEFFFTAYDFDETHPGYAIKVRHGSSVDNIHLAFGLWNLTRYFPEGSEVHSRAKTLLGKMDFSPFFESSFPFPTRILLEDKSGKWVAESSYDYPAEPRSIVPLAILMGLVKKLDQNKLAEAFAQKHRRDLTTVGGQDVLTTWGGNVFQLFTPVLLFGEDRYSRLIEATTQANTSLSLLGQGKSGAKFPYAFSACQTASHFYPQFEHAPEYRGDLGHPELMGELISGSPLTNSEIAERTTVVTPHAMAMLAMQQPMAFTEGFEAVKVMDTPTGPMYRKGYGFMDAIHVDGAKKGLAVPVQLSLDQAFLALSLIRMDGPTPGERAILKDPKINRFLERFYSNIDRWVPLSQIQ